MDSIGRRRRCENKTFNYIARFDFFTEGADTPLQFPTNALLRLLTSSNAVPSIPLCGILHTERKYLRMKYSHSRTSGGHVRLDYSMHSTCATLWPVPKCLDPSLHHTNPNQQTAIGKPATFGWRF